MSVYETSITNPKKQLEFYKDLSEQLEKDNQELKEQLEVGEQQYNDLVEEKEELQEQLSNSHQIKTKQKEFIEWLEDCIKTLEIEQARRFNHTYKYKVDGLKDCLSKYKEIVGGKWVNKN